MKNLLKVLVLAIVLALGIGEAFGQFVWTQDARNPILSGGAPGAWNRNVMRPCVLFNTDSSRYEMWFTASDGTWETGFATSKDGINWTMYPTAVLSPTPGTWDENWVQAPAVIRENGQYKMWYSSYRNIPPVYPYSIGYATSPNGIDWTKYSGNPVLGPGTAAWEAGGPYSCAVMPIPGGYKMWYAGSDSTESNHSMGYATSVDGITWQRDTVHNPVLNYGTTGQWDSPYVGFPNVLQIGNTYYMWYTGNKSGAGEPRRIGVATSNDSGITWTKYPYNPVVSPSPGTWYSRDGLLGSVLQRGDTLDMWFDGWDDTMVGRIGHATSYLVVGVTERLLEVPQHFMLEQNYPNPFNPTTVLRYQLPQASDVRLVVHDMLGREVAVLVNEWKIAGKYEVKFNGSGLSSGVYFYRLTAGVYTESKRMMLVK
jgi:beta-1,2-mannobiose phosphorylase / 1,2-beta-oligomannan phosphorylase